MIPLTLFILLFYGIPLLFLAIRYVFKLRLFSLIAALYVCIFWAYYVSANEVILVNENWVYNPNSTNIMHVYSTTQIPLMPTFPILNILIFMGFMLVDYAGGLIE